MDFSCHLTLADRQLLLSDQTLEITLRLEASSCECLGGTRVTDEETFSSTLGLEIDGLPAGSVLLQDNPSDARALFSNSSTIIGEYKDSRTGLYGYGDSISISLSEQHRLLLAACAADSRPVKMTFKSYDRGMVLYGQRMGRFGCDPWLDFKQIPDHEIGG